MSAVKPSKSRQQQATVSSKELMRRLLDFAPHQLPVISLYLDGRVDEHGQHTFRPFVRKHLTARAATYPVHSPERESFQADSVRILRYLEDELSPSAQGIAIFASSNESYFFEVGQFDAPFERNRLFVSDRPHIYPLARLIDQYRRYAVVLADSNRAKIIVFAAGQTLDRKEVENVKTKRTEVGGWSQSRYQRHLENYHLHHAKEVIDVLERTIKDEAIN